MIHTIAVASNTIGNIKPRVSPVCGAGGGVTGGGVGVTGGGGVSVEYMFVKTNEILVAVGPKVKV